VLVSSKGERALTEVIGKLPEAMAFGRRPAVE
jgi:hypothetical protein